MLALVALFVAWQGVIGADCYWLVALGNSILQSGHVPDGLPFAFAPTSDWPNVPVVAEILFAALEDGAGGHGDSAGLC